MLNGTALFYTEIFLTVLAVLTALYVFSINLIKRFNFNVNRLLALIGLISAVEFTLILQHLLKLDYLPFVQSGRLFIALILYMMQLLFHLIHIYPNKDVMPIIWFFMITGTPGFIFSILTALTDLVIKDVTFNEKIIFHPGKLFYVYIFFIVFYLIAILYVIIQKFKQSETSALTQDLKHFISGFSVSIAIMFIFSFLLPFYFDIYMFLNIGILIPGILILLILNYGVFDYTALHFKKFYYNIASWIIISLILIVPIFLLLRYSDLFLPYENTSIAGLTIVIFLYLFAALNFMKTKSDQIFDAEYNNITAALNNLFQFAGQVSASEDLTAFWKNLYNNAIDTFIERFNISGADLYIYDKKEGYYSFVYGTGSKDQNIKITRNSALIHCFKIYPHAIEESMLYSNLAFREFKSEVLEFFEKNNTKIALPFFDEDKEVFAYLLLGPMQSLDIDMITRMAKEMIYTKTFIDALETYRQHFQRQLLNGLILEEVKRTQIAEHDKMVVTSVKKKILPEKLDQAKGLKVSSFYINNSIYGGDYFDSIKFDDDSICFFISDTSYSGVDSAIQALELYTVFHSVTKNHRSPDLIIKIMNWVITTSQYSKKYSPALCFTFSESDNITYCSASYNPVIIFNPENSEFRKIESRSVPIGVEKGYNYESRSIDLTTGSIGIIYSQGLTASINSREENYSIDTVMEIIKNNRDGSPAVLTRMVYKDYTSFIGEEEQKNDVTLIIFKRT